MTPRTLPFSSLLHALERLRETVEERHPNARVTVPDASGRLSNVSASFFCARSQDGAEVILSVHRDGTRDEIDGELYVERSLDAEMPPLLIHPDGSLPVGTVTALDDFIERCEPLISRYLG